MCDQPGMENVRSAHTPDGNGERHTQCGDSCRQEHNANIDGWITRKNVVN